LKACNSRLSHLILEYKFLLCLSWIEGISSWDYPDSTKHNLKDIAWEYVDFKKQYDSTSFWLMPVFPMTICQIPIHQMTSLPYTSLPLSGELVLGKLAY